MLIYLLFRMAIICRLRVAPYGRIWQFTHSADNFVLIPVAERFGPIDPTSQRTVQPSAPPLA